MGKYEHDGPNGEYISIFILNKTCLKELIPKQCGYLESLASIEIALEAIPLLWSPGGHNKLSEA
jgi:hypothetical protein